MDFVAIEILAKSSGQSRRTIDRKLKKFEQTNPDRYHELVKEPSHVNGRKLYSPEIIAALDIPISSTVIELAKDNLQKVKAELNRDKQKKKDVSHETITPVVISIDPVREDHQFDFDLFTQIINDYKTGEYTFPECVTRYNISYSAVQMWLNTRPAFKSLYDEALKIHSTAFNTYLLELAKESLKKMVTGYDKVMESTTFLQKVAPNGDVVHIPQERKVQQKHVLPNVNAIMFALTNKNPDEWKRMFTNQQANGYEQQDPLEKLTDAELESYVNQAREQGLLSSGDQTASAV